MDDIFHIRSFLFINFHKLKPMQTMDEENQNFLVLGDFS